MENFTPTRYKLLNLLTDRIFDDEGWTLDDPECCESTLIRTVYEKKQIDIKGEEWGVYRFADWLPVNRMLKGSATPVTYKSEGLARYLRCDNLYITFNGYFPERGANMTTCSFKETEAYSVGGRMPESSSRVLVVASAGNTARAFAKVCSENNIPLLLCVPEDNIEALWFENPLNDCVRLISPQSGGDYFDAIYLSQLALRSNKFFAEGGAKNVARRDGMGTTFLSAATAIGEIPDYYFQAVGSGTGAIAAWEANLRLIEDGRFGNKLSKLYVSQNYPFIPMYNAWKEDSRDIPYYSDRQARKDAETINAKVLSNRKPPYGIKGGMYDAVKSTGGEVLYATNEQAEEAKILFLEHEGIDIHCAPAVALATLIESISNGAVDRKKIINLNITGGGEGRFKEGKKLFYLKPSFVFGLEPNDKDVIAKAESLF
ncbi:MAG: cysteate synthase [Rikenellaceae bacterium]|nr:cysteate synthase [Rikenellaceae bacterium]